MSDIQLFFLALISFATELIINHAQYDFSTPIIISCMLILSGTIRFSTGESIHAVVDEMREDGMKVLAVAYNIVKQEITALMRSLTIR